MLRKKKNKKNKLKVLCKTAKEKPESFYDFLDVSFMDPA